MVTRIRLPEFLFVSSRPRAANQLFQSLRFHFVEPCLDGSNNTNCNR